MEQDGLGLNFDHYTLVPQPSKFEPFLWIKELRFYGDGFSDLRRTIKLRQGMNILWSTSTSPEAQGQNKASGHAAGKTLFCRFLRYILGEPTFANERTTQEIQNRFINGVIVAEVRLDGVTWLIVRPIGLRQKHLAYIQTTFDNIESGFLQEPISFKEFQERLNQRFMQKFPLKKFPSTQEDISWDYFYPLLTRDQECHFSHPLNWREAESESESKNPSFEKNCYIIRGLIGDLSTPEQDLIQQRDLLDEKVKCLKNDLPARKYHNDTFRRYLEGLKIPAEMLAFEDGLMFENTMREFKKQIDVLKQSIDQHKPDFRNDEVLEKLNTAKAEEAKVQDEYDKLKNEIEVASIRLKSLNDETLTDPEKIKLTFAEKIKPVDSPFRCNTPISIAIKNGCTCYEQHVPKKNDEWEKVKQEKEREKTAYKIRIDEALDSLTKIKERLSLKQQETQRARDAFRRHQATLFDSITKENEQLLHLRQILTAAEQGQLAYNMMVQTGEELKTQSKKLDELKETINETKKKLSKKDRLVAAFSEVLKHVLNDNFYGKITFDRNSMQLEACCDAKERNSAGYKTINISALDYALLLLGIDGTIPHPGFLLHDSPRESDMDDPIYHSLFEYMKSIEDVFHGENIPFQYIVTTTTKPPQAFLQDPWLLPILDAAIPERRLLGLDL